MNVRNPSDQTPSGEHIDFQLVGVDIQPDNVVRLHERMEEKGAGPALEAGQISVEHALTAPGLTGEERLHWIEKAENAWSKGIRISSNESQYIDHPTGLALIEVAHLPIYRWCATSDKLPDNQTLKETYSSLLGVGRIFVDTLRDVQTQITALKYPATKADTEQRKELIEQRQALKGNAAELSTHLLLHRFGIQLGDQSWLALPAFYGQHHPKQRADDVNYSWDVSVFTDPDATGDISLSYKVQVKSSASNRFPRKAYSPDITVIAVDPNLFLSKRELFFTDKVIRECLFEESEEGNPNMPDIKKRLDERTEHLLNILDAEPVETPPEKTKQRSHNSKAINK